eukprot:1394063-Amorphochlora_amoeboformis.AAC.1
MSFEAMLKELRLWTEGWSGSDHSACLSPGALTPPFSGASMLGATSVDIMFGFAWWRDACVLAVVGWRSQGQRLELGLEGS